MLDNLDTFLLWEIFSSYKNCKETNTWKLAQDWANKNNEVDIDKVYKRIKERLKTYCVWGIFFSSKNGDGRLIFNMDLNKIAFVKHKFNDGIKWCLLIRV